MESVLVPRRPIFISFQNGGGIAQPPAGTRDLPAVGAPALSGTSRQQGKTGNASGRGGPVNESRAEFADPDQLGPPKAARQFKNVSKHGRRKAARHRKAQLERCGRGRVMYCSRARQTSRNVFWTDVFGGAWIVGKVGTAAAIKADSADLFMLKIMWFVGDSAGG